MPLFFKDQSITQSYSYGGYIVLKKIKTKKDKKISFYEAIEVLKENGIEQYKQQFFCLMFLYATGIIHFSQPYVELINHDN